MSKDYNENSIQVLSALDHMKRRSGMYIGSNQDARQLLSEIIDNAIDEVQAGFSNELVIYIDTKKNEYTVRDFGRGIPHGKKKLDNGLEKEIVEVLLTESNSGGKFDTTAYNYSSGLNGLGITITNALSDFIQIETYRNGKVVTGRDENGSGNIVVTYSKTNEPDGTKVTFKPCKKYFHNEKIPVDFAKDRCRVASAMGFRARLIVDEKEIDTDATIFDLIKEEESTKVSTYVNIPMIEVTSSTKEKMKVAIRYTSETNDRYFGFTNLLSNYLGGTHVQELSRTVVQGWKEFVEEHKNIRPSVDLRNDDYLVGMRAVCAVFISAPEYSSQTKEKLVVNKKYFEELMNLFKKEFKKYLKENIVTAQQLIKRFEEYRISQNQLLSRKEISSLIKINNDSSDNIRRRSVVSKLVECTSRSRKETDLYICLKGDTKVKLLSGEAVEIEKLVGKENLWGYSTNEKGQFIPGKIKKVFKTQDVTDMLRITFSDGSTIECTPQHRFLDRDSMSWVEARNMFVGQSMFSMKFRKNIDVPNDHEKVRNYNLKVTRIEDVHYDEPIPVYCLDIDTDSHSFVLENGILSHNCEGDSAKGPFMFTRNPKLQAVLPLRGKILNITNKSVKDAIKNSEICDIANSIGCGIGSACDAEKSRYERIIIAADADPDGQQITCLVLSVFVNMFPDLVKAGRVYIAEPPLYCWGDNPKNYGWCNKVEDVPKGVSFTRMKGLGEMQNSQIEYFLVNPETRNIKQVQFPSDLEEFNAILGTSAGKRNLLKELGIIEVEE